MTSASYPPDWPRCVTCGDFALDGHLTCGRAECDEARARKAKERLVQGEWNERLVRGLLLVLACVLALSASPAEARRRVVVVTIDGTRRADVFQWNERLLEWIATEGSFVPDVTNATRGITDPNHAILWGSGDPGQCVNWEGAPSDPLDAELLRKEFGLPREAVAIVTGKNHCLANAFSSHPDYGAAYEATSILVTTEAPSCMLPSLNYQGPDSLIVLRAIEHCAAFDVAWIGINLSEYDYNAHEKGLVCASDTAAYWARLEQIYREAERLLIDVLWPALDDGNTDLVATTDHGRHDDDVAEGFHAHGHGWLPDSTGCVLNCAGCRDLWAIAIGPDFKQGYVATGSYALNDLARTIELVGGITNPYGTGSPITEIVDAAVRVEIAPPSLSADLFAPRPNPARGDVEIAFSVPEPSAVRLRVVDASGRLVEDLGERLVAEGRHSIRWARGDAAAGTYFVLMETPTSASGRKVALVN